MLNSVHINNGNKLFLSGFNNLTETRDKNILFDFQKNIIIDGENITINVSNAYKYFKNVNIICPISNSSSFYSDEIISNKQNDEIKNNMIVHTLNGLSILTNKFFINNIKILDKSQISKFKNMGQSFNKNNIVIFILTINYFNLKSFLEMFEKNKTIEDLHKIVIISDYLKLDKKHFKVMSEMLKLITNLDGSRYWSSSYNTNYNYDYIIKHRVIDKFNKVNTNINNYENLTIPINKKFTIANLEYKGRTVFKLTPSINFTIEDTNQLFEYFMHDNGLTNLNKSMISSFLLNPKLCHLIINNYTILNYIKDYCSVNVQFSKEFKKCLAYAWISLYNDEIIKDINIVETDRFVIDINTASLLPQYPIESLQLKCNPYFSLLVSDKVINTKNNILGIQATKDMNICNINQFQRQMNIFISGKPYINIFENIDLISKNIVICGSIIPACAIMNHPLLAKFDNNELPHNEDEERIDAILRRFYIEYYSKSDIDMMISDCDHFTFCKRSIDIFNELLLNFCRFFRYAEPALFKLKKIKSIGLFLTEDFLKENGFTHEKILQFKSFINTNDNDNIYNLIKDHIKDDYNKIIDMEYKDLSVEDKLYCDNFLQDFCYKFEELKENDIIVEFNTKIVNKIYTTTNEKCKLYVNTKYGIASPFLNHDIEIFRNKKDDALKLIGNFHLNCVKGYYNGKTVLLLPSCITALKTFVNMDFKYFAGKRNPYQIINKYRMRGFGTILNKKEINAFKTFIDNSKWNKLYKECTNKNCVSCNNLYGFMRLDCNLFSPRQQLPDDFINDKQVVLDLKYTLNNTKIKQNSYDINELIITEKGNIKKI